MSNLQIILTEQVVFGFILKIKQLILRMILSILMLSNLSIVWLLMGNAVCQPTPKSNYGILKNVTIAVPLKHAID